MQARAELLHRIRTVDAQRFESVALEVFAYQAEHNPLYRQFLNLLGKSPARIGQISDIPFLPIAFFKSHQVQSDSWHPQTVFTSSGTTGQTPSRHLIRDTDWYLENALRGFNTFYGDPADWLVLALLPSYLERSGSSLVAMADYFIRRSTVPGSGFFLNDLDRLAEVLKHRPAGTPVLLLGVTFGLLDFAEQFPMNLSGVTIMETGGMKGRREEMTREALHEILQTAFQVPAIHSEYGMTELLSQGYAVGGKVFRPMHTMQIRTTETDDPFAAAPPGKTGQINVVDLANLDTCSFIATEDVGRVYLDGSFEVLGRLDMAEMRGCSLMLI